MKAPRTRTRARTRARTIFAMENGGDPMRALIGEKGTRVRGGPLAASRYAAALLRAALLRAALLRAALFGAMAAAGLWPRGAVALKTERVDFKTSGSYSGQTYVTSDGQGEMTFRDARQTTGVTLSTLADNGARDHGALTGLGRDDHAQYLNSARHSPAHGAAFNASLPTPPDIGGNTTLGGHLGDAAIHLSRSDNETIFGAWRFTATPEMRSNLRFSSGGTSGTVRLWFADGAQDAEIKWNWLTGRFELNRALAGPRGDFGSLRLPVRASPPTENVGEGEAYWNSANDRLYVHDGLAWAEIGAGSGGGSNGKITLEWLASDSDLRTRAAIQYEAQVALSVANFNAGAFALDVSTSDSVANFYVSDGEWIDPFPAEGLTSIDAGKRVFYEMPAPLSLAAYYYARVIAWDGATSSTAAVLVRK